MIDTGQPIDDLLREIRKKSRVRYIRRASDNGFSVERDRELAKIDVFYHLYAQHMRDLGTPVMSIAHMRALKRHFGVARLRLFFLSHAGREVGGMLCIASTDCWLDMYAAVRTELLPLYPNYLLYWRVIEAAAEAGVKSFDLGRSPPHSNAHLFKSKWPGRNREVPHCYFGAPIAAARLDRFREQDSPMQRAWKHLPLSLANWLGPKLRAQLPFG